MREAAALALCLLASIPARADTYATRIQQQLGLDGSIRTGYFSSSRNLDDQENRVTGSVWLKSTPSFGRYVSLVAEGWVRNDDITGDRAGQNMLREGYADLAVGDLDLRVGKQIIAWGRADRFNPTDNLSPRDYRLLTPEDADQRLGTTGAQLSYRFTEVTLSTYWLPRFQPNGIPMTPQPGISYTERIPRFNQSAIKLDHSGGDVDWSVSYFSGLDLNPDFEIGAAEPSAINIVLTHNRMRVLGADTATVVGRYGLRAEAAYTWTSDDRGDLPLVKNPFLYVVMGGDRTFLEYLNVNMQYYFRSVANYHNPDEIADPLLRSVAVQADILAHQLERFEHGLTLRIANQWRHETLEAEVSGIYSLTYHDYAIRPKLIYFFDDHWKGSLGVDLYRGNGRSYFGQLRENSAIYGEIRYSF